MSPHLLPRGQRYPRPKTGAAAVMLIPPRAEAAPYLEMFVLPDLGPQSRRPLSLFVVWLSWRLLSAPFLFLGT